LSLSWVGSTWAPVAGLPVIVEAGSGIITDGKNRRVTREICAN